MKKKMLFIYNPNAGKELIKNKLSDIIVTFRDQDYEVTVYPTRGKKDATRLVIELAEQFDYIVCSGGDGTLNEVADGLMTLENRPPCGYIPAGTMNDFASSLRIPKNMRRAAVVAVKGELFPYDIGCLNGDYFTYVAGFGAFTQVSYETPQSIKNVLGKTAYFLEGLKQLPTIHPYHLIIHYEDQTIEDNFIYGMITNSNSVGGFKGLSGKNVKLDDGLFEMIFIKYPKNPIELQQIVNALLTREYDSKYFYCFQSHKVKITCDEEVSWTVDGEYGGTHLEAVITNHRRAIQFMREKDYLENTR